ncbi:MAG: hypothetical protein NXI31_08950 [bacterium]|nr:hypothetical protein [bacterium]
MRKLVEFEIEGEYSVLVDVEIDGPAGTVEIGRGSPIERAADSFESALSRMRPMVGKIVASLQDLESRPTAVEIEFGA